MSAQNPKVKLLRDMLRAMDDKGSMSPEAMRWAIRVCENADRLVNGMGRRPEDNYRLLEEAVRAE